MRTTAVLVTLAATAATGGVFASAQADTKADPKNGALTAAQAKSLAEKNRQDPARAEGKGGSGHVFEGPRGKEQAKLRQAALEQRMAGTAKIERRGGSDVVKLGDKKYVELGREATDKIFTILVEFGDKVDNETMYDPDGDGPKPPIKKYGGTPGPLHNKISEPDRKTDNSTAWKKDYNRQHFQDLYFGSGKGKESLKTYFEKTSSGRYSVEGTVTDWVKVDYNEARYGSNYCGGNNCPNVEDLVRDGVGAWVAAEKAKGRTDAQIKADITKYDVWDRTDHDGDGVFNEPDGYIDHFQIVHAGEDGSAGGGAQGTDALWAHRGYAYSRDDGDTGPGNYKAGGVAIGDTGIWVGDYTMQPENGGLGVFAHEYGHDLGLPDLYDTTSAAENSVGFWSLMSAGSWLGTGKNEIGDLPGDMTAWDKLQLGWLKYEKVRHDDTNVRTLGVAEYNTQRLQSLLVELPKKRATTQIVKPVQGSKQWWSDYGDDLSNTLQRDVDLTGKAKASLELDAWWNIEADYDYLYTQVSTDGGASWKSIDGTADGKTITRDGGDKPALTGDSGAFKKLVFPLDAYAGKKIGVRFRYKTDGGAGGKGFTADNLTVKADGVALFNDDAEGDDNGWTARGFSRAGESIVGDYENYYILENRQHVSYDKTLKVGPYNFGWRTKGDPKYNWVEHYQYVPGLMIWQWDGSQRNNNVSEHPGEGLILPIDAHAKPLKWADGKNISNKMQPFDAAFSKYGTKAFTLHKAGVPTRIPAQKGVPVFDDHKYTYWYADNPTGSVKVRDTNTRISILSQPKSGSTITVKVSPSKRR